MRYDAYSTEWHAIAYDRAETGYLLTQMTRSCPITITQILSRRKWLSVFGPKRCYLLLEKEYLVFSDSNDNILFRRIFDTKRLDGQEIFLKQNLLQCIQENRVCDQMFTLHACCEQDRMAQNGVYVVTDPIQS